MQRARVVPGCTSGRGEHLDRLGLRAMPPQRHGKLSKDPTFVDKAGGIVGRCLNPPDHAVVLRVEANNQVQAFNRTRAMLARGVLTQR